MEGIPDSRFSIRLENYWRERGRLEHRLADPEAVRRNSREARLEDLIARLIPDTVKQCAR